MRQWAKSPVPYACGNCTDILPSGSPVLRLFLPGLNHAKLRCVKCAGESVPDVLPEQTASPVQAKFLTQVDQDWIERPIASSSPARPMQTLAQDFTNRYLGEK